jgi:large-conductance mechanosensitive channel
MVIKFVIIAFLDFLTIKDIINKVKEFSDKNPIKELQIRDFISLEQLVAIIERVYSPIKFRKPEVS